MPTRSPEFIIDGILPSREIHLLGGPSGAGKTTWLFQMLNDQWHESGQVLGRKVNPVPFIYVSADRSKDSILRTMKRAKIRPDAVPLLCLTERPDIQSVPGLIDAVLKLNPDTKLFIIDGVMRLVPKRQDRNTDGGFHHISNFLASLNKLCFDRDITLILIVHSPKQHEESRYANHRERVMGSTAWAAYSETVILVEFSIPLNKENASCRTLICLSRNDVTEFRELVFNADGQLVDRIDEVDDMLISHFLLRLGDGDTFAVDDFLKAVGTKMSRATAYRRLKELETKVQIERISQGVYRKRQAN